MWYAIIQDKCIDMVLRSACIPYDSTAACFSWCTTGVLHQDLMASSNTQAMTGTLAGLLLASIAQTVTFADNLISVNYAALLALKEL